MVTSSKITNSVKITVVPVYDSKNSYPSGNHFVFRYDVTIENMRASSIKILSRLWKIFDAANGYSIVSGEGVVGVSPEIKPGESYHYYSNVSLKTSMGSMKGSYIALDLERNNKLEVEIPKFELIAKMMNN